MKYIMLLILLVGCGPNVDKYGVTRSIITDYYTNRIIKFIERRNNTDQPFFAFVSFTAPHNPLHAPADVAEPRVPFLHRRHR